MNLLMISLHADPTVPAGIGEGGGTHSYIRELLTYFSTKNINILLITRKCNPNLPESEQLSATCTVCRIIIKGEHSINKKELFSLHDISVNRIKDVLRLNTFMPDLIHSIYWNSGQIASEICQYLKIPFVHTVISNGLRRKMIGINEVITERFSVEKEIFQNATYIFCITPSEKEDLINLYQIDHQKIIVSGRPVAVDFLYPSHDNFGDPYFFKLNKNDISLKSDIKLKFGLKTNKIASNNWWNNKAFLYCGRIALNKGINIIIEAWINLKIKCTDNCPPLWIVGGAPEEIESIRSYMKLRFNIEKYEYRSELIWWGYLDQRGISTLYLKTIALIMHSSYEPGGRVIIEALAAGIPVIATPNGFGADYIINWFNGFQVSYGDVNSLCNRMLLFVKQPYLSNNLGINAKNYIKSILDMWNFLDLHYTVYQSTIDGKKRISINTNTVSPKAQYVKYVNMYPFFNDIISLNDLYLLIDNYFEKPFIIKSYENPKSQALWEMQTEDIQYEICQPYSKLFDQCYYNPFFHEYIDTRIDIYSREKYTSNITGINPVIKFFDDYYIYIKRLFPSLNYQDLSDTYAPKLLRELLLGFESSTNSIPINTMRKLMNKSWIESDYTEIEEDIHTYFEITPSFFYHSTNVCLGLSLRQIYFMLINRSNCIPKDFIDLYFKCITFLNQIAYTNAPIITLCIEECSIENIVYDRFSSRYLFKDANTIYWGDNSRMPAYFIYHYLLHSHSSKQHDDIEKYIKEFGNTHNEKLCLGWLFEIAFEQIIHSIIISDDNDYIKKYHILCKLIAEYIV